MTVRVLLSALGVWWSKERNLTSNAADDAAQRAWSGAPLVLVAITSPPIRMKPVTGRAHPVRKVNRSGQNDDHGLHRWVAEALVD